MHDDTITTATTTTNDVDSYCETHSRKSPYPLWFLPATSTHSSRNHQDFLRFYHTTKSVCVSRELVLSAGSTCIIINIINDCTTFNQQTDFGVIIARRYDFLKLLCVLSGWLFMSCRLLTDLLDFLRR